MSSVVMINKKEQAHFTAPTSFHDFRIETTFNRLIELFGKPGFYEDEDPDKVSCEWLLELEINDKVIPFTIYDWKQYGNFPVHNQEEFFEFHVGTVTKEEGVEVQAQLLKSLNEEKVI